MPTVTFIEPGGKHRHVEAPDGLTLLEIAHRNGIDIEGACEGCMACSTCHVIVDAAWLDRLPAPSEEEADMLDLAWSLTHASRLGYQIILTGELDGLVVSLPAEARNLLSG